MHSHTIVSLLSIWALMFVSQVSVNWGDSWSMALHPFHFQLQHIQILIGACRSQSVDNQGSMYLWWSWQWADKKGLWKTLTPPTARSGFSIDPVKKRRLQEYMAEFKSSLSNVTESQSFVSAMFSPTAWKVASSKSFLIHWVWPVL